MSARTLRHVFKEHGQDTPTRAGLWLVRKDNGRIDAFPMAPRHLGKPMPGCRFLDPRIVVDALDPKRLSRVRAEERERIAAMLDAEDTDHARHLAEKVRALGDP